MIPKTNRWSRNLGRTSFALAVLAPAILPTALRAQSGDALVDKLVQKGILTVDEAQDLKAEADKDFKAAYSMKSGMPDWVSSFKINGSFRGRYDGFYENGNNYGPKPAPEANTFANADRTQLRYRLLLGMTATLEDHFEIGIRLGSGQIGSALAAQGIGGAIFSQNQTLGSDGTAKSVFIDAAYAKWTPNEHLQVQIGKMDNQLWFTDAIIDPDYQPEGAQERVSFNLGEKHQIGLTAGQWVIGENNSANRQSPAAATTGSVNNDVYLFLNQLDLKSQWTKKISTRFAAGNYAFKNQYAMAPSLETTLSTFQNGTPAVNVPGSSVVGAQHFNPLIGRGEFTYLLDSFPLFQGEFPLTFGAEYFWNPGASDAAFTGKNYSGRGNEGYNLGLLVGSAKKKHNWQLSYNFKTIETAATWRGMVDDDFGFNERGGTDVRGHLVRGVYRVYDSMTCGFSFFHTEQISNPPGTQSKQDRIFVDLVWSF